MLCCLFMFNSQAVRSICIHHISAQEKRIQSVQPMVRLIPTHAFSAMNNCKNNCKTKYGSPKIMKKPSQNDRKTHVFDSPGTVCTENNYSLCKSHRNTLVLFPEILISGSSFVFELSNITLWIFCKCISQLVELNLIITIY